MSRTVGTALLKSLQQKPAGRRFFRKDRRISPRSWLQLVKNCDLNTRLPTGHPMTNATEVTGRSESTSRTGTIPFTHAPAITLLLSLLREELSKCRCHAVSR